MKRTDLKVQRLVALFALGFLLFNFPTLSLFNADVFVFGIPRLFLYFFAVWIFFIACMAWILEPKSDDKQRAGE